jgi:hypothetical protein
MKENFHIDDFFRRSLADNETPPPPHTWGKIDATLEHDRLNRRLWLRLWHSVPAFISAVFLVGILLPTPSETAQFAETNDNVQTDSGRLQIASNGKKKPGTFKPLTNTKDILIWSEDISELLQPPSQLFRNENVAPQNQLVQQNSSDLSENSATEVVYVNRPELNQEVEQNETYIYSEFRLSTPEIVVNHAILNALPQKSPTLLDSEALFGYGKTKRIGLRILGGPMMEMRKNQETATNYASIFGSNNSFTEISSVQIRSGLEASYSIGFNKWDLDIFGGIILQAGEKKTKRENLMSTPLNQIGINTHSLPIYTSIGTLSGISLYPNLGAADSEGPELSADVGSNESIKSVNQQIAYLSLPLGIGVSRYWGKWRTFASIGAGPAFLIQNSVIGERVGGNEYLGETQRLAPVHWQMTSEAGFGFHISNVFEIGSSFMFQGALSSVSSASDTRINPIYLGGAAWLRLNLCGFQPNRNPNK